jgi:hypothetical protein
MQVAVPHRAPEEPLAREVRGASASKGQAPAPSAHLLPRLDHTSSASIPADTPTPQRTLKMTVKVRTAKNRLIVAWSDS